jgi:diguanylate cyclase (GGDEF)-like protein
LRNRALRRVVVLAGALLAPVAGLRADEGAWAPARAVHLLIDPAPPGHLPWVVFDERSGLPQHTAVDLLSDPQGYVWAATQDGLARYDGRAWEPVPLPRSMGSNYPRAMKAARDGGLWIGTFDGGLARLKDGAWTVVDVAAGLPSNRIRGLLETVGADGKTALWIATENGVARLVDGRLTAYGAGSGLPSLDTEALCETRALDGTPALVVGTTNGLARFAGDHFVPVPVPRAILGHRIGDVVESVGLSGGKALWITSYGAGMGVLENGAWTLLDRSSGLPSDVEVLTRSRADDGSPALWIGTEGGLMRFEHGRFTLFDERSGLPIRIIWKVLETTAPGGLRTIWLGTWGGGIVRLAPSVWTAFDATNGLPSGSVTSMVLSKTSSGAETLWAGTSDGQLARFDGRRFERVEMPEPLRHGIVFWLLETHARDGTPTLWVSGFGGGVGLLHDGRWTLMDTRSLPSQRVYKIVETRDDDGESVLWFCSEGGLGKLERGAWTYYRKELPSELVPEVLETRARDGSRSLWAATSRGLARLHDGRWTRYGKADGMVSENVVALAAAQDAQGARWLWAGTFAGGASRLRLDDVEAGRPARFETFTSTTSPALPSDTVMSIAVDAARRVYLFTTHGASRLTPRVPTDSDPAPFSAELFTTDDGLPSGDFQQSARLVDQDGRVWAGTAKGLAMLDPRRERLDRTAKPLLIESASLSDKRRVLRGGDELSHAERNLTFSPALLAWGGEERIRYRYQLAGFDPQPSEWTASAVKEYTNLGAGAYVFRVWGRDAHGNVSGPAELPFRVRSAPWMTAWAFTLYGLALFGVVYGGTQWRVRALARRTRELENVVAERTRDLVSARDQLEQLASIDALTGVANRRVFDATFEQAWKHAQRGGDWISVVLLDVDFFKRYNDRYGHAKGDACLRAVAGAFAAHCRRANDLVARYGGEEFALVLPETAPDDVRRLLVAVLSEVDALALPHAESAAAPHVTVSLGAVSVRPRAEDDRLVSLEHADRLLYESKAGGRHRGLTRIRRGGSRSFPRWRTFWPAAEEPRRAPGLRRDLAPL